MDNSDNNIVLGFSKSLFWDVEIDTIDHEKHASYIVERVLSRGEWADFKALINHYGKKRVADYAANIRYLDDMVLNFCTTYFKQSKENFRCYTQKQLNQTL
jgi:hypothetical protein